MAGNDDNFGGSCVGTRGVRGVRDVSTRVRADGSCMCVYVCVCMCVYVCVHVEVSTRVRADGSCICMFMCMYVCVCMCVCMWK